MRACLLLRTVCRRGCWLSVCEPGETAVSRAGCLPWNDAAWLECRLSRPGRVGPGGGLGEDEATAAEGMAAAVGWDVEALGIVVVVAINGGSGRLLLRTPGLSPHGGYTGWWRPSASRSQQ